jgi:hypothetical protein
VKLELFGALEKEISQGKWKALHSIHRCLYVLRKLYLGGCPSRPQINDDGTADGGWPGACKHWLPAHAKPVLYFYHTASSIPGGSPALMTCVYEVVLCVGGPGDMVRFSLLVSQPECGGWQRVTQLGFGSDWMIEGRSKRKK